MNCEETTGLLSDRLKGLLTADDERKLEAHLDGCAACREEAAAVDALWNDMGVVDDDVPHERMRARFHAALAAYDQRSESRGFGAAFERIWLRPAFQFAAAAALLVAGFVAGRSLPSGMETEIAGLRGDLQSVSLALLDHQSASERLLGIAWSRRAAAYAPVADALIGVARNDSNVNVRLAAVEALSEHLDRPEVGAALTDALGRETEPLIQVTLAGVLLENGVSGSVAAVEKLAARDDLDSTVRDYLRATLQEVESRAPRAEAL